MVSCDEGKNVQSMARTIQVRKKCVFYYQRGQSKIMEDVEKVKEWERWV